MKFGFLARMRMDPVQRRLARPSDYDLQVDPDLLEQEISERMPGFGHVEMRRHMLSTLHRYKSNHRPVTLRNLSGDAEDARKSADCASGAELREFLLAGQLGAEGLTSYLVHRTNELARTLKPGSPLGDIGRKDAK